MWTFAKNVNARTRVCGTFPAYSGCPPTIAEVLDRYTPEQRAVLFDYFEHAAPAFRAATEQIRAVNVASS